MDKALIWGALLLFSPLSWAQIILPPVMQGPPSGGGGISLHSSCVATPSGGVGATSIQTGSCNVSTNDVVMVACSQDTDTTAPTGVTDTIGNTYTHLSAADATYSTTILLTSWWTKSTGSNASNKATCTWSGSHTYRAAQQRAYSGLTGSSDATMTASAQAASLTSSTFTTTAANEAIIACVNAGSTNTYTAGTIAGASATNLLADGSSGSQDLACEDLIVSSIETSQTASMSFTFANAVLSGATFK